MSSELIPSQTTSEDPVTLYLSGTGAVTHHIGRMIGTAVQQGMLDIGGTFEPVEKNRREFIEQLGITPDFPEFDSFEELLEGIGEDTSESKLMGIFSPVRRHGEQALGALSSGVSVAIMKPMASSVTEARQIIDSANSQNLVVHCSPTHRDFPAYKQAREWITSGRIGRVLGLENHSVFPGHEFTQQTNARPYYLGEFGTALGDLYTYPADFAHSLLGGPPQEVLVESRQTLPTRTQNGKEFEVEGPDYWHITEKYTDPDEPGSSPLAVIEVGFVPSTRGDWETKIHGSLGSIAIYSGEPNRYTAELYGRWGEGELLESYEAGIGLGPEYNDEDAHVFKDILTAAASVQRLARSQEPVENISAYNALETLHVIEAIQRAQNTGRFHPVGGVEERARRT